MEIPVTNTGATNLHIAGRVITPGSTRMVEESLVPAEHRPVAATAAEDPPPTPASSFADLLDGPIPEVVAALPSLSAEQLEELALEEMEGKDRKGVFEAIEEERLRRAQSQG